MTLFEKEVEKRNKENRKLMQAPGSLSRESEDLWESEDYRFAQEEGFLW
jgi:hypothetical protein